MSRSPTKALHDRIGFEEGQAGIEMQAAASFGDVPSGMPSLRTSAPGRLRSLLMDGTDPVLLLGAGASITSGIPAADKTVEKVARWAWCKEHGRHLDDFSIRYPLPRLLALAYGPALV